MKTEYTQLNYKGANLNITYKVPKFVPMSDDMMNPPSVGHDQLYITKIEYKGENVTDLFNDMDLLAELEDKIKLKLM